MSVGAARPARLALAMLVCAAPALAASAAPGPAFSDAAADAATRPSVPVRSAGAVRFRAPEAPTGPIVPLCGAARPAPAAEDPPAYYRIELVPTRRVPGTGNASGFGAVSFAPSPFGLSISPQGTYVYELEIRLDGLRPPRRGAYVAWVTTSDLDQVVRIGAFDETLRLSGRVEWNKFLVVVTLEPAAGEAADSWQGPIILRGMSRSGNMHTLAGHGPFEAEPCVKYGYQ